MTEKRNVCKRMDAGGCLPIHTANPNLSVDFFVYYLMKKKI